AKSQVQRSRDREKPGLFDQQFRPARAHDNPTLPLALANRVVLQVDQTASSYQKFLRHHRKRCQNSNLDRYLRLRARGHHQKTAQPIGESLRTPTDSKPNVVRKSPPNSTTCRFRLSNRVAGSSQTIESIQLTLGHYYVRPHNDHHDIQPLVPEKTLAPSEFDRENTGAR